MARRINVGHDMDRPAFRPRLVRGAAGILRQHVEAGTALIVLEAMKMEHSIRSAQAGVVKSLFCNEGEMVSEGAVLLEMEEA